MNSATYHLMINATDACGLRADHSTHVVIQVLRPVSTTTPTFTATLYTFTISHLATPGIVIGYLHLPTGRIYLSVVKLNCVRTFI